MRLVPPGKDDETIITLEKEVHDGIQIKRRRAADLKSAPTTPGKTTGFGHTFEQGTLTVLRPL